MRFVNFIYYEESSRDGYKVFYYDKENIRVRLGTGRRGEDFNFLFLLVG